jgi:hypothetical protein
MTTPEFRESQSKLIIDSYKKQKVKDKHLAGVLRAWQDEENIANRIDSQNNRETRIKKGDGVIYTYLHLDGTIFVGYQFEFRDAYPDFCGSKLSLVSRGKRKSHKGWSLVSKSN